MRIKSWLFIIVLLFLGGSTFVLSAKAEEAHSYFYKNIDIEAMVNQDTTVDVAENQTYDFTGTYHQGLRTIPLRRIDAITDIQVLDGATHKPLVYSANNLEKTLSSSWNKYTYRRSDNNIEIEWYYNAKDEVRNWIIKYKVHGSLEFLKDNDRFYWNLFTDYSVPVKTASIRVYLPKGADLSVAGWEVYPSGGTAFADKRTDSQDYFSATGENFSPQGMFTVNLFWPRGAVDRSAYLSDFWHLRYGFIISLFLLILTILIGITRWLVTEYFVIGRGTVIPQYEPPQGMTPAEMQVILKETVNNRALAATIIDLAVRGYVTIEEDKTLAWLGRWAKKDYKVVRTDKEQSGLKKYEKEYLAALFWRGSEYFSTREMRSSSNRERATALQMDVSKLSDSIYESTDPDGKYYEVSPLKEKIKWIVWITSGIILFTCLFVANGLFFSLAQYWYVVFSVILLGSCLFVFFKYETRLNQVGRELKEEVLGFKMFLYSAERYRLQNLTPDAFEKYLPYAMIFKIEKQWAQTFANRDVSQPSWYYTGYYGSDSSISAGTFSATAFSASFVSSFTSSFSSSSGSGSGGSSGGGGGGGGGGAS